MTLILCLMMITSVLGLFQFFNIGTFGFVPIEVSMSLVFLYAVYHTVWLGRPLRVPRRIEMITMCLLLVVIATSSITAVVSGNSIMMAQGLKTLLHFAFLWMAAFLLIVLPISSKQWITALRVHFAVSFVVVLFAAYQLPARTFEWPLGWIEITNQTFRRLDKEATEINQLALRFADFYRATSIFSEPSALAGYSAVSLMMMLVPLFRGSRTIIKSKTFLILSITFTTIALFLSFSMSGMVFVAAILALSVVLYPKTAPKRMATFLAAAVVLLLIADFTIEKNFNISVMTLFATRVENLATGQAITEGSDIIGESATQRTNDYYVSGKVFESSPIVGVGAGNFGNSEVGRANLTLYPSTVYGSVLGEMGIIGMCIFLSFLFLIYGRSQAVERWWTKYRCGEDSDLDRLIPMLPFRILIVFCGGFFGSYLISAIFWIDVVIVMSVTSLARREMGIDSSKEIYFVKRPWRQRFIENRLEREHLGV